MVFPKRANQFKKNRRRLAASFTASPFELLEPRHALSGETILASSVNISPSSGDGQLTLNPKVQLSHFGQDIAFTETAVGVASIPITSGGSGYTPLTAKINIAPPPSGGVLATATATILNGVITGYTLATTATGTGYGPYWDPTSKTTITPKIAVTGKCTTPAIFSAHVNSNGYLDFISSFTGGSGYTIAPTVTVTGAVGPNNNATIKINPIENLNGGPAGGPTFPGISSGTITGIVVTNSGKGYTSGQAVTVTIGNGTAPSGVVAAVLGAVNAGSVNVPSRGTFQRWAKDYITYVANTGVSTAIINIGDWKADTKGLYNYLNPALGVGANGQPTGIPWIVTDFLEPLGRLKKQDGTPADIQVGACAYLKDAWHLYGNALDGTEEPGNVNFEGNEYITDGKPGVTVGSVTTYSPPKNNMYQTFELINDINSKATTKFLTYFEFDGEGGSAFVNDTNYGFNGNTAPPKLGGVVSASVTASGSGYAVAPAVTFGAAPVGGTTATGVALLGQLGQVVGIAITNSGSGYISAPTVKFAAPPVGGISAKANAVLPTAAYTYTPTASPTTPPPTTSITWPTTGTGYTKWLWNHFMPGVAAQDTPSNPGIRPGGNVPVAASGYSVPDVVWTDAEAMDPLTWSGNPNSLPYQYGSIVYQQPAWFVNSPGPVRAYSENYWWGENNYMPGPGSAIAVPKPANGLISIPVTDTTVYTGTPTVTFNTPTRTGPNGTITGTPAAGYAVMGVGAVDVTPGTPTAPATILLPLPPTNLGTGYSTGIWVSSFPTVGGGYTNGDIITFNNTNPNGRSAVGTLAVDTSGNKGSVPLSVSLTDPGAGWTVEPTVYTITSSVPGSTPHSDLNIPTKKATFQALLLAADGYPTLTFDPPPQGTGNRTAQGYALVTPQSYKPGSITSIVITDPGQGYGWTSNTSLDGTTAAQLVATMTSDGTTPDPSGTKVLSVTVTNGGSGYTTATLPNITFTNSDSITCVTAATGTAVLGAAGQVVSVNITSGSGYKSSHVPAYNTAPAVTAAASKNPLSGVKMYISNKAVAQNILSQYSLTKGPTTFQAAGISTLPANSSPNYGTNGFYLPVSHGAGTIDHIVVSRIGDHYGSAVTNTPSYTITQQSGKAGAAVPVQVDSSTYNKAYAPIFDLGGSYIIDGNGLSLINIVDGGAGYSAGAIVTSSGKYSVAPKVVFTGGGGGSGATGLATIDPNTFKLISVQITNPGSGYTTEPTISFQRVTTGTTKDTFTDTTPANIATATAYVINYPKVTIGQGRPESILTPAQAYALTIPVDKTANNYTTGYSVQSILFTNRGAGYVPTKGMTSGTPPTLTATDIAALPTMTVSAPAQPGGRQATVDGQFQITSKWNAFWLDGLGSITNEIGLATKAAPEAVGSVTVTNGGTGYSTDAIVTFDPSPTGNKADTAVGYVILNPIGSPNAGSVSRIAITNPGAGYTSTSLPNAKITSASGTGSGATVTVTVNSLVPRIRGGGSVYNYTIGNGAPSDQVQSIVIAPASAPSELHPNAGTSFLNGTGYRVGDTVSFAPAVGDSGSGAAATVFTTDGTSGIDKVTNLPMGGVATFTITSKGSGYKSPPTATITSTNGTGAIIQANLSTLVLSKNSADAVYAHYKDSPEALALMFNDPLYTAEPGLPKLGSSFYQKLDMQQDNAQLKNVPNNSKGIGQSGIATFSLESVLLSNTGPAAIALGAASGASATATVSGGSVTAVNLAIVAGSGGSGYLTPPLVQFGGPGIGATAIATVDATTGSPTFGQVTGFTNIFGGTGYTSAPTVTLVSQGSCLDAKYHNPNELSTINALGGTFGGLSSLTYNDFITFLNTAADIVVGSQKSTGINVSTPANYIPAAGKTILFTNSLPDAVNIRVGMSVEGPNVPAGTNVVSIGQATATAWKSLTNGNWTVTVNSSDSGYSASVGNLPKVVITGDGTGATATATVDPTTGKVTAINLVTSATGTSYTWMNVSIQQSSLITLNKALLANTTDMVFYNPISASDVTFSIYDNAFLPLAWLTGKVTNRWSEPSTAPFFSNLLTVGTVAENLPVGTVIYTAQASDNDSVAPNNKITYSLKPGVQDYALLNINPVSGQVTLKVPADYESKSSYQFTVVATDGGATPLSVEKAVTVNVTNVNEFPAILGFNTTTGVLQVSQTVSNFPGAQSLSDPQSLTGVFPFGFSNIMTGDFNGDLQTEVVGMDSRGVWSVAERNASGGLALKSFGGFPYSTTWSNVMTGDFNGDGKTDIIGRDSRGYWYTGESNGTRFVFSYAGAFVSSVTWQNVMTGDFNGNGRTEIIGRDSRGYWYGAETVATGQWAGKLSFTYRGAFGISATWQDVMTGDFNGDGKTDIIGRDSRGYWYGAETVATGQWAGKLSFTYRGAFGISATWQNVMTGDFNGDGKTDLIGRDARGYWYVGESIATARGQALSFHSYNAAWSTSGPTAIALGSSRIIVADFNRDGRSDIAGLGADGYWRVTFAAGTGTTATAGGTYARFGRWTSLPSQTFALSYR